MASASMAAPLAPLSPLSLSTQDVLPASSFGMILPAFQFFHLGISPESDRSASQTHGDAHRARRCRTTDAG